MTPRQRNLGVFSLSKPIAKTLNLLLALMNKNIRALRPYQAWKILQSAIACMTARKLTHVIMSQT